MILKSTRSLLPLALYAFAIFVGLLVAAGFSARVAVAAGAQSLQSIQAAAEKHVLKEIPAPSVPGSDNRPTVLATAGALDSRLRLEECGKELRTFLPPGARIQMRVTVGVSCSTGSGWTVYVPVNVESEAAVLVLREGANRDAHLTIADVEIRRQRLPGLSSFYISDATSLRGRHVKRSIPAGTLLTTDILVPDLLVRRGQQVMLISNTSGIEVRAAGKALSEGGASDRVKVQNLGSLRVIEGVVESADTVRVGA